MPTYKAPVADMLFVLHDVLSLGTGAVPGYEDLDRDTTAAILGEAAKLAQEVLAPLNRTGDRQGCVLDKGMVRTPDGFRAAFDQLRAGGWPALDCDPAYGGQGLPYLLATAVGEMFSSANMAFNMYQGLTHGACSAIHAHGTEAQKALYLPRLVRCDWTGTMNLTEPQCGTDLGLMRTRADPQADGSYRITGQKIFISAGDHDLAENVVHLVLAKIPGGPEGTRGVSLFIVPKFLPDAEGRPGARNALSVGKLEEKMGIHGNATCVMDYDGATGFLLGEAHKGMRAMFTMMNEARIGVGLQGYAQAAVASQAAVAYARERLQGRAPREAANPQGAADPLIVHPDIRRLLMDQKSFVEGARAFTFWGAQLIDEAERLPDPAAQGLVSLLTPVIKGFLTDRGFDATVAAQQVFGGHGYIEDSGMPQFVRDARIAMIYEGTNGVQALDLVSRKLGAEGGRPIRALFDRIDRLVAPQIGQDAAWDAEFLIPLQTATADLRAAALFFLDHAATAPEEVLAGSTDFLHLAGHVGLGYMWLRMAQAAREALAAGRGDPEFLTAKLATGRYYMARQLPLTRTHLARIKSGASPVMALDATAF